MNRLAYARMDCACVKLKTKSNHQHNQFKTCLTSIDIDAFYTNMRSPEDTWFNIDCKHNLRAKFYVTGTFVCVH